MDPAILQILADTVGPDGPYPLGPVTVDGQAYMNFGPPAPQTLVDVFDKVRTNPDAWDQTFVVYQEERLSFRDVLRMVDSLAAEMLNEYGVCPGDRVAIAMRNLPEFVVAYMAAVSIRAVAVPLNGWWTGKELEYALGDCEPSLLIADQERYNRALPYLETFHLSKRTILVRPDLASTAGPATLFSSILRKYESAPLQLSGTRAVRPVPDDLATIMYTSGTTGHPKGVMSTHRAIVSALNMIGVLYTILGKVAEAKRKAAGVTAPPDQECILLSVPLFHATATHAVFLPCFYTTRRLVIMRKWDAADALRLVQAEKVTHFTGVPTMAYEMLNHPDRDKFDTSSLQFLSGGGAPTPPSMVGEIPKAFKNAAPGQGFGMTETNAVTTLNSAQSYLSKPSSCGRPALNVQLRIADDDLRELPTGHVGEVLIRGPTLMSGYWKKPEATAEMLVRDADGCLWLRSGDVGKVDDEGFLYILDRKKDLIIRGGENISCSEVEAAVYEHPGVAEAAAFGLPDARLGEQVAMALVMKPSHSPLTVDALKAFLKSKGTLADFKMPSMVFIWPGAQLPRGATGKILKKDVRKHFTDLIASSPTGKPISKL